MVLPRRSLRAIHRSRERIGRMRRWCHVIAPSSSSPSRHVSVTRASSSVPRVPAVDRASGPAATDTEESLMELKRRIPALALGGTVLAATRIPGTPPEAAGTRPRPHGPTPLAPVRAKSSHGRLCVGSGQGPAPQTAPKAPRLVPPARSNPAKSVV